jgi:hypothetical protein
MRLVTGFLALASHGSMAALDVNWQA